MLLLNSEFETIKVIILKNFIFVYVSIEDLIWLENI